MELTINEKVYQFNFGMGFLREVNKRVNIPVDGLPGVKENVGLRYTVGMLVANDVETLVEVLDIANKGQQPRATKAEIDSYIDDPETDIDKLFADVLDFLRTSNATRKTVREVLEAFEARKMPKEN